MYLAGVSVRRVEDETEAFWGTEVSASTISDLNNKVYSKIEDWRQRKLTETYSYLYLDGIFLKRSWGGEVVSFSVLVAIGASKGFLAEREPSLEEHIGVVGYGAASPVADNTNHDGHWANRKTGSEGGQQGGLGGIRPTRGATGRPAHGAVGNGHGAGRGIARKPTHPQPDFRIRII
jgi:hypothetical protein